MMETLSKALKLISKSFDETALLSGISDVMIVRWDSGQYRSTPFLVCFGHQATTLEHKKISVKVNGSKIQNVDFNVDSYGYLHPMRPSQEILNRLMLKNGKNQVEFSLKNGSTLRCEIHLYKQSDKVLVSDVDGTLTKSDFEGLMGNALGKNKLHQGYAELIKKAQSNGCKIVWLTMRSLSLYQFSKSYIQNFTKVSGVLLTEPEQFIPALKKEVMRNTGNTKTNMMKTIRNIFPSEVDPFVGGLGNRENDAIAYRAANIALSQIFIVDPKSKVHKLGSHRTLTYTQLSCNFDEHFCSSPKQSHKCNTKLCEKTKVSLKKKLSATTNSSEKANSQTLI